MSKDFGYFLITIGIIWLLFTIPIEVSFMNNPYTLPLGLIIIGGVMLITSYFGVKHVSSIAFFIFIALWLKAGAWTPSPSLTEQYSEIINASSQSILEIQCGACESTIMMSHNDIQVNNNYTKGLSFKSEKQDNKIKLFSEGFGGSKNMIRIPIIKGLNYEIGVGSLCVKSSSIESVNISTGVGSIKLGDLIFTNLITSTGIGSIELNVTNVNSEVSVDLSTGIGSIEVNVIEGLEYKIDASAGLGSVDNELGLYSSDYDEVEDKLYTHASTGIGSIKIKRI
jgi:hypothetical protein